MGILTQTDSAEAPFPHSTPETAEFLGEDLLQVEQRLEPAKRAAHNVHKRLQACLQGQSGADMDKRVVSGISGRKRPVR